MSAHLAIGDDDLAPTIVLYGDLGVMLLIDAKASATAARRADALMGASGVQGPAVAGRLVSPTAAKAVLDASSRLIEEMPVALAANPDVCASLQRLACQVEDAIASADHVGWREHGQD